VSEPQRVLIVEDDDLVYRAFARILRRFYVKRASTRTLAWRFAGEAWDCIVCDLSLVSPRYLDRLTPEQRTRVVWVTGYPAGSPQWLQAEVTGRPVLAKPIAADEARAALLDAYEQAARLGVTLTIKRDSWGWRWLLWFIPRRFATTIGPWIGLPDDWAERDDASKAALLRHELVHVRQFRWCGLGSAVLGIPLMALLYFGWPLPIGLAWTRWRLERAAYREQIATHVRLGTGRADGVREDAAAALSGASYLWTWPRAWARKGLG
jgi:ActR/RegA family two-component response regulator